MLVLLLKEDEKLRIGNDITLQFKRKIEPDQEPSKQVSVAVSAPKDVEVLREELTNVPR